MQRRQTQKPKRTNAPASSPVTPTRLGTVARGADSKPRQNKRRALSRDKRQYHFVDEVADLTGTSERTIWRDIDDGRLIATYFRDACRIADTDLKRYLRQQRGPRQLLKRRRSPRTKSKTHNTGETS